jgi:multicomponent Na+:H+ antiporter subunit B
MPKREGMTLIVKEVTRLITAPIFIFGIYLTLTGHLTPGGGFPGGVVFACGFVLVVLAYGGKRAFRRLPPEGASKYDSGGALLFLFIGLLGTFFGGHFLYNFLRVYLPGTIFHLVSAGTMPLLNIAIGMKVAASLFLVVMALTLFRLSGEEGGES